MVDQPNPDTVPFQQPEETTPPSPLIKGCVVLVYLVVAIILGTVLAICFGPASGCATAYAQQPGVFGEQPPPDAGSCMLIFPVGDLTKVLLQANNRVELDAHEHVIQLQPGASPIVTCKVYRGIHRPTQPVTKQWKVAEIKYVEADVFQKLVDEAIGNVDADRGEEKTDPYDPMAKKTAKGPPVLPTVPLNPNTPR